jgi:hypothetical protein
MSVLTLSGSSAAGGGASYTRALLELLGDRDPVEVLRATPAAISVMMSGLGAAQLERPEKPGKWSIRHVVQHLADSELIGAVRLRLMLAQDRPPLTGFDQDLWAERLRYQEVPFADALDQFTLVRRVNLRLWEHLTEGDLARVGVHSERGDETLGFTRMLFAGHDLAHLRQLTRIRDAIEVT